MKTRWSVLLATVVLSAVWAGSAAAMPRAFVGPLTRHSVVASTVPANGDINPYGVAVVPRSTGKLVAGDVLVSNFNASSNFQGTGTTIVQVSPGGGRTVFAHLDSMTLPGACPGGVGLTTALGVLRSGWVIVGSLPTSDGSAATAKAGCLIVLDKHGMPVETFSGGGINGPWDMATIDGGSTATLFVSNVLNGTVAAGGMTVHHGTVLRLRLAVAGHPMPMMTASRVVASGFGEHSDPAALVVGPTGLGLGMGGTLYVADSASNRITDIPDAMTRTTPVMTGHVVTRGGALNTPLGLTIAPNGDILTVNAGDGRLVETTPSGHQIAVRWLDRSGSPPGAGALFGLAVRPDHRAVYYVDDAVNTLNLLHH
ncbi:MAG: hypothetical protein ACTHNU_05100 [Gaiellales bacterium]